jgi:hypothetical protein
MSCEFSEAIPASAGLFSPNGQHVAFTSGCRLTIRSADDLKAVQIFTCVDKPDKVEFSPDSSYVLCIYLLRAAVQCFSLSDPEWKCRINEGAAGLINAHWLPDSRGIVTVSDFGVQLSIWSLLDGTSQVILNPKQGLGHVHSTPGPFPFTSTTNLGNQQLISFSDCSRFMAVVHRMDLHDYIGTYATSRSGTGANAEPFAELSKFKCRGSAQGNDVCAVYWTPGGTNIITVDSPISYKVALYTASGEVSLLFVSGVLHAACSMQHAALHIRF